MFHLPVFLGVLRIFVENVCRYSYNVVSRFLVVGANTVNKKFLAGRQKMTEFDHNPNYHHSKESIIVNAIA